MFVGGLRARVRHAARGAASVGSRVAGRCYSTTPIPIPFLQRRAWVFPSRSGVNDCTKARCLRYFVAECILRCAAATGLRIDLAYRKTLKLFCMKVSAFAHRSTTRGLAECRHWRCAAVRRCLTKIQETYDAQHSSGPGPDPGRVSGRDRPAGGECDRHRRGHREQRPHDRDAEAHAVLRAGQPRHPREVGDAGRGRAAPARHHRHRHAGRPVRRDDDRHARDPDLGQEGLAAGDQARRRLRRRRPAARDPQRPVVRRQAVRRAVLRRELDADVPQGSRRQGRRQVRRPPDVGPGARRRRQDERPEGRRVRHLPARQAGLGRQHGLPHDDGQRLRRPVVRHVVEAAARKQAVA